MAKLLIIEDDVSLANKVREWFEFEKHVVDVAHGGEDGWQLLSSFQYDAIVLDLSLGDVDGLKVLEKYRSSGGSAAVVILTGKRELEDKEVGLDLGADDYITKPFHIRELSARIRAVLRRPRAITSEALTVGDVKLDLDGRKVFCGETQIHLAPKEFQLLEFLMRHPGKTFTSKNLLEQLWDIDAEVSDETIRTLVKRLRNKVFAHTTAVVFRTAHGHGYILEASE